MKETVVYKYTRAEIIELLKERLAAKGLIVSTDTVKWSEYIRRGPYNGDEEFASIEFTVTREKEP